MRSRNVGRLLGWILALWCGGVLRAAPLVVETPPKTPDEERQALHVPNGFEVQLVASEPDIHKPINMAFDDRGRLWVTDTIEYPFPAPEGSKTRDTVKILEDFDENGRARKITTFADNLNIPIGVLPLGDNAALLYSIPYIWKLTDTHGAGHADKRDVFLGTFEHVDTHGMTGSFTEGFDGWIYAVHGYRNTSTIKASDGSQITMNSGNVYRFKRDASHVEYFTHGQVNPFGLCFDPLGDLFSSDCETMPVALLLREAYYPSFGKPDDGLGFAPDVIDHFYGSTAIAGLCDYVAEQFPPAYRDRMLVGNVVTNRINNARLSRRGSGFHGDDVPDFVVSDDGWFRPTNIKLGPDGAIYVSDFYNRIIGHYEVDLHHPGRDKQRGRIWRIVYKGLDATSAPTKKFDLTAATVGEMVDDLASPNLTIRMLAMNRLADIVGQPAVVPVKQMVAETHNPFQKAHGLWVLLRLGALDAGLLKSATSDASAVVREHAMRMLAEMPHWSEGERGLALAGAKDADPLVRRTAADALGRHPEFRNIHPLLELAQRSDSDPFLAHVVRIALRDQLARPGVCPQLSSMKLSEREEDLLATSAIGAPTSEAAAFLLHHLLKATDSREQMTRDLRAIARLVPENQVDELAQFVQSKFGDDLDLQLALFKSVQEGLDERGTTAGEAVRAWGTSLASSLLKAQAGDAEAWTYLPLPGSTDRRNPWDVQVRRSSDGDASSSFFSSNVHGEQLTGLVRSKTFACPSQLTFYLAGHNGPPPRVWQTKNLVRVRDAGTNEVLATAQPPRNDVAQKITLNLSRYVGRQVYFEAQDADSASAYAWLAFGRFDPSVVRVPVSGPRLQSALQIVASLHLTALATEVENLLTNSRSDQETRATAARTIGRLGGAAHMDALRTIVRDSSAPDAVREAAAGVLASLDSPAARAAVVDAIQTAPQVLQRELAQTLAGTPGGAAALLEAVRQGKASARLLQDETIRERLAVLNIPNLSEEIRALTKGLPAADAQIQKLIDQRAAGFDPSKASAQRGRVVFEKTCMVCHSIGVKGGHVGPPLEGIGIRGVPRLCEDILDPSRNVAAEFRSHTFVLNDETVVAGIPRREEGHVIIVADSTGKEVPVPKAKIVRQVESKLSLMPSNFGEVIPPQDFDDLIAYLLTMKQK